MSYSGEYFMRRFPSSGATSGAVPGLTVVSEGPLFGTAPGSRTAFFRRAGLTGLTPTLAGPHFSRIAGLRIARLTASSFGKARLSGVRFPAGSSILYFMGQAHRQVGRQNSATWTSVQQSSSWWIFGAVLTFALRAFHPGLFPRTSLAVLQRNEFAPIHNSGQPCVERTGTSRSAHLQFGRHWRLVPAAHAGRWAL